MSCHVSLIWLVLLCEPRHSCHVNFPSSVRKKFLFAEFQLSLCLEMTNASKLLLLLEFRGHRTDQSQNSARNSNCNLSKINRLCVCVSTSLYFHPKGTIRLILWMRNCQWPPSKKKSSAHRETPGKEFKCQEHVTLRDLSLFAKIIKPHLKHITNVY